MATEVTADRETSAPQCCVSYKSGSRDKMPMPGTLTVFGIPCEDRVSKKVYTHTYT